MIRSYSLIAFLFLLKAGFAQSDSLPAINSKDTTYILGISFVNNEDSLHLTEPNANKGGGLDMSRYFGTYLKNTLYPCGDKIYKTVEEWIKKHQLVVSSDYASETRVELSIWENGYKGLFKFHYKVRPDGSYARIWMDYHTLSGEKLPPESIPHLLHKYQLSQFYDDLKNSIKCSE